MSFRRVADPSALDVPNQEPVIWNNNGGNNLTVPNQDIPPAGNIVGFLNGSDNVFRTSDGMIYDFKTRRILRYANQSGGEYWGNPDRVISLGSENIHDDTGPSIEDMLNGVKPDSIRADAIDPKSAAYWLKAEEEAEKLRAGMSDAQKQMLADFEKHFPKSKLIEESLKGKTK